MPTCSTDGDTSATSGGCDFHASSDPRGAAPRRNLEPLWNLFHLTQRDDLSHWGSATELLLTALGQFLLSSDRMPSSEGVAMSRILARPSTRSEARLERLEAVKAIESSSTCTRFTARRLRRRSVGQLFTRHDLRHRRADFSRGTEELRAYMRNPNVPFGASLHVQRDDRRRDDAARCCNSLIWGPGTMASDDPISIDAGRADRRLPRNRDPDRRQPEVQQVERELQSTVATWTRAGSASPSGRRDRSGKAMTGTHQPSISTTCRLRPRGCRHPLHHRAKRCASRAFYSDVLGGQVVMEENHAW